ncbi:MAG TPA: DUF6602 domain-containing protein [Nitrososphaeraceae archaeon]|jgi:hypothetical protein|nr:DUF6602 domain-containing protein [Nitrososphaeraceae archaeon]
MSRIQHNVYENLAIYFQDEADILDLRASKASIFQNKPDTGDKRENILADFLNRHLPDRCKVNKGGYIIDSYNNESRQTDIVITNDLSLQFKEYHELEKVFTCIEGCYALISVKSYLSKGELFDALDNLYSIPRLKLKRSQISPTIEDPNNILEEMPCRIVFAFDGPEIETTKINLAEHQQVKGIEPEHMVNLIVVNNKYHISKVGYGGYQDPGGLFQEWGMMQTYNRTKFIGGFSLMHMITRIQKISNFSSLIAPDFDEYYKQMKISAERMDR